MPKITFVAPDHTRQTHDIPLGTTLMRGAVTNDIDGIAAECGGNLQCATCHVYIDPTHQHTLQPIAPDEDTMLAFTACPRQPNSRLSCQLPITPDLEGLIVHLPEQQHY
jgi:2Fe-2S ferredoxin